MGIVKYTPKSTSVMSPHVLSPSYDSHSYFMLFSLSQYLKQIPDIIL